jgi:ABC-type polysaccharide/polyol phosphate export permease
MTTDLILEAGRTEKNYWRDLWRYRELFIILAWRDVTVRYKQTGIQLSVVLTAALCLSGIWYFRKMERTFADVI